MKLVVLSDNRANDALFETEHGLSLYVEAENHCFLLDTGSSDTFIRNAKRLGIDLSAVDYVFLSHAHADHTGGLEAFMAINDKATIILAPAIIKQRCFSSRSGGLRENGLPIDLTPWKDRLLYVDDTLNVGVDVCFYRCLIDRFAVPKANATLWTGQIGSVVPDAFEHERVACFGNDHPLLFIGCAHKGLLNILSDFTNRFAKVPSIVVGGFHLLDAHIGTPYESVEEIRHLAAWLTAYYPTTTFLTGHCTGDLVFEHFKQIMDRQVQQFYAGLVLRANT